MIWIGNPVTHHPLQGPERFLQITTTLMQNRSMPRRPWWWVPGDRLHPEGFSAVSVAAQFQRKEIRAWRQGSPWNPIARPVPGCRCSQAKRRNAPVSESGSNPAVSVVQIRAGWQLATEAVAWNPRTRYSMIWRRNGGISIDGPCYSIPEGNPEWPDVRRSSSTRS